MTIVDCDIEQQNKQNVFNIFCIIPAIQLTHLCLASHKGQNMAADQGLPGLQRCISIKNKFKKVHQAPLKWKLDLSNLQW